MLSAEMFTDASKMTHASAVVPRRHPKPLARSRSRSLRVARAKKSRGIAQAQAPVFFIQHQSCNDTRDSRYLLSYQLQKCRAPATRRGSTSRILYQISTSL